MTIIETAAEARKRKSDEAVIKATGGLLLLPLEAWLLMLVLGALHVAGAPVAAIGYGTALLIVLGVDLLAFTTKKFRR
ncbi:hypothetical protein AB0D97_14110 [Streptomyces roseus]|uniref:hypothetical protein n=1 Tax=Streptomyces roseus TaxID=66430 RepID=UPI0033CA079A